MADLFKEKWDTFCENLKEVGSIIESESSLSETDQAEGYRYLLRLMRLSLEMNMEHSNPSTPSFYNLSHETAKIGGSSASKHLTREVVLEEAAVGLKILIDANRPTSTDFQVYARTCDIDEQITEKDFVLIPQEAEIPADDNPNVFRQYDYLYGGLGGDILDFKKYQIKIVLRSTNQAFSPVLDNLRVIALST